MTNFDEEYDHIFDDVAPDDVAAKTKRKDYKVGYGKPPKEHQFKPGVSGHPPGRPKGTRNVKTDAKAVLAVPVKVNKDGKTKKVSSQYAIFLKLREKALKGDSRAIDKMIDLAMTFNSEDLAVIQPNLSDDDEEILSLHESSILESAGTRLAENQCDHTDSSATTEQVISDPNDDVEEDDDAWLK